MSAREWRQGDVAIRTTSPHMSFRDECRTIAVHCYDDSHGPDLHWHHDHGGWDSIPDGDLYEPTYRPLIVIDPEDREQVERLAEMYEHSPSVTPADQMQAALREFANPTPPKPEVYSHVVMNRAMPGEIAQSLCGKVWKPGADATVVGECPECKSLAGEWIA